jgi:hypothetical protein
VESKIHKRLVRRFAESFWIAKFTSVRRFAISDLVIPVIAPKIRIVFVDVSILVVLVDRVFGLMH